MIPYAGISLLVYQLLYFHGFLSSFVSLDQSLQATLLYWHDETRGEHVLGLVQM